MRVFPWFRVGLVEDRGKQRARLNSAACQQNIKESGGFHVDLKFVSSVQSEATMV